MCFAWRCESPPIEIARRNQKTRHRAEHRVGRPAWLWPNLPSSGAGPDLLKPQRRATYERSIPTEYQVTTGFVLQQAGWPSTDKEGGW